MRGTRPGLPGRALFGNALAFIQVMRELDLGEIQRQFDEPARILVTATRRADAERLTNDLFGATPQSGWTVRTAALAEPDLSAERPDLVLLAITPTEDPLTLLKQFRADAQRAETPVLGIVLGAAPLAVNAYEGIPSFRLIASPAGTAEELLTLVPPAALDLVPDLTLALGRRYPVFRPSAADRLIRESSRVNGQFALMSSIPANLPIVGGVASGVADMALLTKNQGVLVYKLAGLYGRNLDDRMTLAIEIAPVIGGAFVWRSVARSLLALVPGIIGGLPKAGVAYAGTYAVGEMARYYYSTGSKPSPELVQKFQVEGARLAAELAARLRQLGQPR